MISWFSLIGLLLIGFVLGAIVMACFAWRSAGGHEAPVTYGPYDAEERYVEVKVTCNHPQVFETMACDAVCSRCGENLGFIGDPFLQTK